MNKGNINKVWQGIFSPPCPRCGSTKTRVLGGSEPLIMRGDEIVKWLKNRMEGKSNKPVQSWECLDCETKFDEGKHYIAYKK